MISVSFYIINSKYPPTIGGVDKVCFYWYLKTIINKTLVSQRTGGLGKNSLLMIWKKAVLFLPQRKPLESSQPFAELPPRKASWPKHALLMSPRRSQLLDCAFLGILLPEPSVLFVYLRVASWARLREPTLRQTRSRAVAKHHGCGAVRYSHSPFLLIPITYMSRNPCNQLYESEELEKKNHA